MVIKAKYVGAGEFYHGIPARDLSNEDFERLTAEQQELVGNSRLYQMAEAKAEAKANKPRKTEE